jgi:hypothetical protein
MANTKKNNPIGFYLQNITTEQFALIEDSFDNSNSEANMEIGLKFGVDKGNKIVAAYVKVQFEQKKVPFLIVEVADHFGIDESAWDSFVKSDNKMIIPQKFAAHLVMLTIGTLRGVMHCKTENTELNKFVLPTINVTEMIKDDIELDY